MKRPLHSIERSSCELPPDLQPVTNIPFDLELCDGVISTIIRTISLTILAMLLHRIGQRVASVPLVLQNSRAIQRLRDPSLVGQDVESNDLEKVFPPPPHT